MHALTFQAMRPALVAMVALFLIVGGDSGSGGSSGPG